MFFKKTSILLTLVLLQYVVFNTMAQHSSLVYRGNDGKLVYATDQKGNVIPDFSGVGYRNSEADMPNVAVVKTLTPIVGDNTQQIQDAIDEVAQLPLKGDGFRGAILLKAGIYHVKNTISIHASGIILRGEGESTHLIATDTRQYNLISINNSGLQKTEQTKTIKMITDDFVPIGTKTIRVEPNHSFVKGDWVHVRRVPKQSWINLLGMDSLSYDDPEDVNWTTSTYTVNYERKIVAVDGNILTLDAPMVDVIDSDYAKGYVLKISDLRIRNCGVEHMKLSCTYASPTDELHAWNGIYINHAAHCRIKKVSAYHFGFGCVSIAARASFITVDSCSMFDHISELGGSRRYSFNVNGQRCLIQNCTTRNGRHDYAQGSCVPGPNVFYNCIATKQHSDIGPHQRWATGTLFDNITGDGEMNAQNRLHSGTGHGWAGSQILYWNCIANKYTLHDPPSWHRNWMIGCIGTITNKGLEATEPLGVVESNDTHVVDIPSLFVAQLQERLANILPETNTVSYYSNEETEKLRSDLEAGLYDIYELTTSGGNYVFSSTGTSPLRINKSFTLRASEGLERKPVISLFRNSTSTTTYMFYPSDSVEINIEGLIIDGKNIAGVEAGQPNFIRIATGSENSKIDIKDCFFKDFSNTAGIFRIDAAGGSLNIQRTVFNTCSGNLLNFITPNLAYGSLDIKDATFSNITGQSYLINYAEGSSAESITIDHCTVDNVGSGRSNLFQFKEVKGILEITNSIFSSENRSLASFVKTPIIDYCYLDGLTGMPEGLHFTNSFTGIIPVYKDPANLNYELLNDSLFLCRNGLPAGNTMYYNDNPNYSQTIQQYAEEDVIQLMTDMNAGVYDIYELTTSGGDYTLVTTGLSPVRPPKSFTLRAAEGLSKKPVVSLSRANTSTTTYMFYPTDTIVATFKGVELNGVNKAGSGYGQPNFFRTYTTNEQVKIVIRDCSFYGFTNSTGIFRIDAAGTSVDIQGSLFKNNSATVLNFLSGSMNYGSVLLKNNTFIDLKGTASLIAYSSGSTGTDILLNHCTIKDFSSSRDLFVLKKINGSVQINNSLFYSVNGGFNFSNPIPVIHNCYLAGFATTPTGNITNTFSGTLPVFADVEGLHYGLTNYARFVCSEGLPVGNSMYYLEKPVTLPAINVSNEGFTISWNAVPHAKGYQVLLYQGSTLIQTDELASDEFKYTFTALTGGKIYEYRVVALNKRLGFDSEASDAKEVQILETTGYTENQVLKYIWAVGNEIRLSEVGNLQVYNLQGTLVYQGQNSIVYKTELSDGIYIVRATMNPEESYMKKMIINK